MRSIMNWRAPARRCRKPPLALIRLQWWREVVEGARRRHEVAEPLSAAIDAGALRREDLLGLLMQGRPRPRLQSRPHANGMNIYVQAPVGWPLQPHVSWALRTPRSFGPLALHSGLPACCAAWVRMHDKDAACCRSTSSRGITCCRIRSSLILRRVLAQLLNWHVRSWRCCDTRDCHGPGLPRRYLQSWPAGIYAGRRCSRVHAVQAIGWRL